MSVTSTSLFDKTNNRFDPGVSNDLFDTKLQYLVEIDGAKTLFDTALFSDPPFDTSRGDIITFTDSAAQSLQSQRGISTSISLSDTPTRVLASLRSITASSISLSDSLAKVKSALRSISASAITFSESLTKITPTVNRYLYDLGALFDTAYFSSPPFDTAIQSHPITDSLARSDINKETITEPSISLSDSVSRVYNSIRGLTESISLNDSISRLFNAFRTITQSISLSDNVSGLATTFRNITTSTINFSDSVAKSIGKYRTISVSTAITEVLQGGKLVLVPLRNTVQFVKELRNTRYIITTKRLTTQFIKTVRNSVTL